ncbi:MAG: S8 family serine peptidase, partial [Gaiellaceae bacterium]
PTPFSSTGPWVDLFAPGVGIEVDTTLEHDQSGNVTDGGTSFSSAIVAAAAAWVWTERPKLSAAQVFALIEGTAENGVLDIPAALAAPTPRNDPREPNDTVAEAARQAALKLPNRISATLDADKDPRDIYRLAIPKHKHVRLSVSGPVVARLKGAYAEVSLRPGVTAAAYTLRIRTG